MKKGNGMTWWPQPSAPIAAPFWFCVLPSFFLRLACFPTATALRKSSTFQSQSHKSLLGLCPCQSLDPCFLVLHDSGTRNWESRRKWESEQIVSRLIMGSGTTATSAVAFASNHVVGGARMPGVAEDWVGRYLFLLPQALGLRVVNSRCSCCPLFLHACERRSCYWWAACSVYTAGLSAKRCVDAIVAGDCHEVFALTSAGSLHSQALVACRMCPGAVWHW